MGNDAAFSRAQTIRFRPRRCRLGCRCCELPERLDTRNDGAQAKDNGINVFYTRKWLPHDHPAREGRWKIAVLSEDESSPFLPTIDQSLLRNVIPI